MLDYIRYYHLETFIFEDVHRRFHADGLISAFDFFAIVIWKANRAKSRIATRILRRAGSSDLEAAVAEMSRSLFAAETPRERLRILMKEWGFMLPMATAVLAVLWPEDFTVYDVRVCDELNGYRNLGNRTRFEDVWTLYKEYRDAVAGAAPAECSLRDKDRFLWGRSSARQLQADIARRFAKRT